MHRTKFYLYCIHFLPMFVNLKSRDVSYIFEKISSTMDTTTYNSVSI